MKRKDQPATEPKDESIEREHSTEYLEPMAVIEKSSAAREKFRLIKNEDYRPAKPVGRARLPIKPKLPPAA